MSALARKAVVAVMPPQFRGGRIPAAPESLNKVLST
jgi:hypothetical protein